MSTPTARRSLALLVLLAACGSPQWQAGTVEYPTVMLSLRQREVLQLVAEGKSNKEIASTINVTVKTIEFHKARISKELGVRTTAELTKEAITLGLIAAPEKQASH